MVCKGSHQRDVIRFVEVMEFGVDDGEIVSEPLCPSCPKMPPFALSRLHDSIGDGLCHSSEQIRDMRLSMNWNKVQ